MKRWKLIKYLKAHSCIFLKEGSNHSIYINTKNKKVTSVGRHREIKDRLAEKICKDLGIPNIKK